MADRTYSLLQKTIQKIASSRPGAWIFARVQHHLDRAFLKLSNNRATMTSLLAGLPVVMLTTTGAKSGLPRTVPLLAIEDNLDPSTIALVASNWGQKRYPAWYYNLKANPEATGAINGVAKQYSAREVDGTEYERFWGLATAVYAGYPLYQQRVGNRHIPVFVLTPRD